VPSEQPPIRGSQHVRSARRRTRRYWFLRRVVYPLVVVGAIVAAIWWLGYRDSGGVSTSGARYGPVDIPAALNSPGPAIEPEEGNLAPDFVLESLNGREMRLSDLRGKAVVINFWATWCQPCRKEIPNLIEAYHKYRERGLLILGVNLQEGKSIIEPFADDFGMDFPILLDRTGSVADEYRLLGLPTTFFIDRRGVVQSRFTGPFLEKANGTNVSDAIDVSELQKRIEEILR